MRGVKLGVLDEPVRHTAGDTPLTACSAAPSRGCSAFWSPFSADRGAARANCGWVGRRGIGREVGVWRFLHAHRCKKRHGTAMPAETERPTQPQFV